MKKEIIYAWACDLSLNRGEGLLANIFLRELSNYTKKRIVCRSLFERKTFQKGKKIEDKNYNLIKKKDTLFEKYISPLLGFFFLWKKYLCGEKVAYINYLPLWNILLIIFLPPRTILGPITGNKYNYKVINISTFIRKYIFPILYKISLFIVFKRLKLVFFSTDILRKFLNKEKYKKSFFNFNLNSLKSEKKTQKQKIILIYFRKHQTKKNNFHFEIIRRLTNLKFEVHVFGDKLNLKNVVNHNVISIKNKNKLLKKSMFAINSGENFYSFFLLECISHHMKVFYDTASKPHELLINKKFLIPLDYNDIGKSYYKIKNVLIKKKHTLNNKHNITKINEMMKKRSFLYFDQFNHI